MKELLDSVASNEGGQVIVFIGAFVSTGGCSRAKATICSFSPDPSPE